MKEEPQSLFLCNWPVEFSQDSLLETLDDLWPEPVESRELVRLEELPLRPNQQPSLPEVRGIILDYSDSDNAQVAFAVLSDHSVETYRGEAVKLIVKFVQLPSGPVPGKSEDVEFVEPLAKRRKVAGDQGESQNSLQWHGASDDWADNWKDSSSWSEQNHSWAESDWENSRNEDSWNTDDVKAGSDQAHQQESKAQTEAQRYKHSVRLEGVPKEYTHETLKQLHSRCGLDVSSMLDSHFMDVQDSSQDTCLVLIRYTDLESAKRASEKLNGKKVSGSSGQSFRLAATVRTTPWIHGSAAGAAASSDLPVEHGGGKPRPTKKMVDSSPATEEKQEKHDSKEDQAWRNSLLSVLIYPIPLELSEDDIRMLHVGKGLAGPNLPMSIKIIPSKDPSSETCSAMLRYRSAECAEQAIRNLYGTGFTTRSGEKKKLGARRARKEESQMDETIQEGHADGVKEESNAHDDVLQVWIREIPVEFGEEGVKKLHIDNGLGGHNLPTSVKYVPNRSPHSETCCCVVRYSDEKCVQSVLQTLDGLTVTTRTGQKKPLRVVLSSELSAEEIDLTAEGDNDSGHDVSLAQPSKETLEKIREKQRAYNAMVMRQRLGASPEEMQALSAQYEEKKKIADNAMRMPEERHDFFNSPGESAPMLEYFCNVWKLDNATVSWLRCLPLDVQTALTEQFHEDNSAQTLLPYGPAEDLPSEQVVVGGLPAGFDKGLLATCFGRFGKVMMTKMIIDPASPTLCSALIRFSTVEEAKMAVEDINFRCLPSGHMPLSVRYAGRNSMDIKVYNGMRVTPQTGTLNTGYSISEGNYPPVPTGKLLVGAVKMWQPMMAAGLLVRNGFGPDIFCPASALIDADSLIPGSTVLFQAAWDEGKSHYQCYMCITQPATVQGMLVATAGVSRSIRKFARLILMQLRGTSALDVQP